MEHAEIELLLGREMPHIGHKRLPERAIIRPFGKDFVDRRVMNRWCPIGVLRHGQALPHSTQFSGNALSPSRLS